MALDYMDLKGQLRDEITVDEYAAKMGMDSDIVTVTFTTHSNLAAKDLVTWFERGYDFVLDADVSPGELDDGTYKVYVELDIEDMSDIQVYPNTLDNSLRFVGASSYNFDNTII